ncbi:MAG: hypothetical protein LBT47_12670 [Deltaproteobacteria bacterium]|jgi:hypothetical protein|nr:hypothetical protein [Deltaproteobacteria bacterium]
MMDQLTPFMKKLTKAERDDIYNKAMAALEQGDDDEYDRLCYMLPVNPQSANDIKKLIGIEALIASGINLIEAVETYGEEWLNN